MAKPKYRAREYALKFLFFLQAGAHNGQNLLVSDEDLSDHLDELFSEFDQSFQIPDGEHPNNILSDHETHLARQLIRGLTPKRQELVGIANEYLTKKNFSSLDRIEQAILLLGVYELKNGDQAANKIISNYIDLAKTFGPEDSFSLINAVLDAVHK